MIEFHTNSLSIPRLLGTSVLLFLMPGTVAKAQSSDDQVHKLEMRVSAQDARIAELERLIASKNLSQSSQEVGHATNVQQATEPAVAARLSIESPASDGLLDGFDISGDFRLRQEFNWSDNSNPDRTRNALRARLGVAYKMSDPLTIGARITTGDPDDPNSTDVTLSSFADDLSISLDQIYLKYQQGSLTLYGGKFPQIVRRTDLVWDGDVNPQGAGAVFSLPISDVTSIDARGLYFIIDEAVGGKGSAMVGGQIGVTTSLTPDWRVDLALSYYDYMLDSVAGADSGDFRGNLLAVDGRYLSDFNLAEVIGTLGYNGFHSRWPMGVTADFVKNIGAATSADTGYSIELFGGQTKQRGDFRLSYSFAAADSDAVLAAFSHDNFAISTGYRAHSLSMDYALQRNLIFNATYNRYSQKIAASSGLVGGDSDWINRLRLNALFVFK